MRTASDGPCPLCGLHMAGDGHEALGDPFHVTDGGVRLLRLNVGCKATKKSFFIQCQADRRQQ